MKKVLLILGGLFILLLVVILLLPFIIDLNKYRGEIKTRVEKRLHAEFNIGELSMKGLGVEIKDLSLKAKGDFRQKSILHVKEAKIKFSLLSLIKLKPVATLVLKKPVIHVVKNKRGTLNLTDILGEATAGSKGVSLGFGGSGGSGGSGEVPGGEGKKESLSTAEKALPGFILGANLSFLARNASLKYADEGSGSSTEVENLNISLKNISVNRPIAFAISALLSTGEEEKSFFQGKVSWAGKARVQAGKSDKISKVSLNSKFSLGELIANVNGQITDIQTLQTQFKIKTPTLSLAKLKTSFHPLREYDFDGTVLLEGELNGSLKDYQKCEVNAKVHLTVKSKETELTFKSTLSDTLDQLRSEFVVESSHLNLDEILPKKEMAGFSLISAVYADEKGKELSTAALRKSPILRGLTAKGSVNLKKITYRNSVMSNLKGNVNVKRLRLTLSRFGLNAFKGKLGMKGTFNMDADEPTYRLTAVAQKLKLNPMVTMASPVLKDMVTGTLNANMNINGQGVSMEKVKEHLAGRGNIDLKNAELKGLNMGNSVIEAIKTIALFAGAEGLDEQFSGKIDSIRSSLIIQKGKLFTPDATLLAPGYKGTLKGYASFDKEINYEGRLFLPANKFKSRFIASLADSKGMVGFPFKLKGVLPEYTFEVDTAEVAKMAAKATLKETIKKETGIDVPFELPF